jgi:hypothetical protein
MRTDASTLANALNLYTGDDHYSDVIWPCDFVDEDLTIEAAGSSADAVVILEGTCIQWDARTDTWYVR